MIRVIAKIKLYSDKRQTPFRTGYRPLFDLIKETKTSGQITLIEGFEFFPGEEGEVEIAFLNEKFLGKNFGVGTRFTFGEGRYPIGEGEVKKIL